MTPCACGGRLDLRRFEQQKAGASPGLRVSLFLSLAGEAVGVGGDGARCCRCCCGRRRASRCRSGTRTRGGSVEAGPGAAADHAGAGGAGDGDALVGSGGDRGVVGHLDDRGQLAARTEAACSSLEPTASAAISLEPTESGPRSLAVSDWSATSEEVTEAAPRSPAMSESGATSGEETAFSAISSRRPGRGRFWPS